MTAPAEPDPPHGPIDPTGPSGFDAWVARGREMSEVVAATRAKARTRRFDTIAVHGVYDHLAAARNQGSLIEPVYASPAQHFADSDELEAALAYLMPAWGYTRIANPTTGYLEETLALLETYATDIEASCVVTSSGMAAVHLATNALLAADADLPKPNLVASAKCYGGTFMLFSRYQAERGIEVRWIADPLDTDAWAAAIDEGTRFLYVEVPSNPALALADIPALAEVAHDAGLPLIVDSTVATPALLRPLGLGADIVIHSLSKAIGASGLAIAGAVVARRDIVMRSGADDLRADFATHLKLLPSRDMGASLSPQAALALLSDLRTLRTRMDAWSRSTMAVARYLDGHRDVDRVLYPGLLEHPGHIGGGAGLPPGRWRRRGARGGPLRDAAGVHAARRGRGGAPDVRPAGAGLPGDGPRPREERGRDPVHLHAPAAGRGRARDGADPARAWCGSRSAGSTRPT